MKGRDRLKVVERLPHQLVDADLHDLVALANAKEVAHQQPLYAVRDHRVDLHILAAGQNDQRLSEQFLVEIALVELLRTVLDQQKGRVPDQNGVLHVLVAAGVRRRVGKRLGRGEVLRRLLRKVLSAREML